MNEINEKNIQTVDKVRLLSDKINDATKELEKLSKPTWFFSKKPLNTTIKITGLQNKIEELETERRHLIGTVSRKTRRIMAGLPIENSKPPVITKPNAAAVERDAKRAAQIQENADRFQALVKKGKEDEAARIAKEQAARKAKKEERNKLRKKNDNRQQLGGRRLTRSKRRAASTRRKRV